MSKAINALEELLKEANIEFKTAVVNEMQESTKETLEEAGIHLSDENIKKFNEMLLDNSTVTYKSPSNN